MENVNLKIESSSLTKKEIAEQLEISRTTLDKRISLGDWKRSELYLLKAVLG